ncbi:acyl-CoA thioesterase [Bacillus marasmi]|uniref:acyl-CoA thioesterase n=1 Tax=Bacillus marasmi TaxID=1926279 RepID=UPI0011C7FBF8|nr:thioesterase family protein [Bacillus marasmi]
MEHQTYIKTRYCETDAFGHVNNVSYFIYLEQARVDFFIDTCILEKSDNWNFVVASAHCDYIGQAYVNQNLVVKTTVSRIGRSSVTLKHTVINQTNEEIIAKGEVVLVCFDFTKQKSEPLAERVVGKLNNYVRD